MTVKEAWFQVGEQVTIRHGHGTVWTIVRILPDRHDGHGIGYEVRCGLHKRAVDESACKRLAESMA